MYVGGALIISATILVTLASHRRKSQGAVKRQLSFSSLPKTDDEDMAVEMFMAKPRAAHERAHGPS